MQLIGDPAAAARNKTALPSSFSRVASFSFQPFRLIVDNIKKELEAFIRRKRNRRLIYRYGTRVLFNAFYGAETHETGMFV